MQREQSSDKFPIGTPLPTFELLNVDGKKFGTTYLKGGKAALVVFTCNHCPYVKGSEEMLVQICKKFEALGLRMVSINSNDASQYPDDSYKMMQKKSNSMQLPYPYLHDASQAVAKLFDAACTPECFLFDSKHRLAYHGTINDNPKDKKGVTKDFLSPAIVQVLAGEAAQPNFVHPLGCSIKWRA